VAASNLMVGDPGRHPRRPAAARTLHRRSSAQPGPGRQLLNQTLGTRFGGVWAGRVLLLLLVAFLRAWSQREAPWERTGAWVAVGVLAAALAVTPPLGGHAAAGPYPGVGAVVGVLHFWAAAVWFGGLVLLGLCALPHADEGLLAAVPPFSSVAFTAMVVTVVTGTAQGWRQLRSVSAAWDTGYGRLLVAKVAVFVVLIAVAGRSRALVRRRLTARVLAGTAPPDHQASDAAFPRLAGDDADARPLLLRDWSLPRSPSRSWSWPSPRCSASRHRQARRRFPLGNSTRGDVAGWRRRDEAGSGLLVLAVAVRTPWCWPSTWRSAAGGVQHRVPGSRAAR